MTVFENNGFEQHHDIATPYFQKKRLTNQQSQEICTIAANQQKSSQEHNIIYEFLTPSQ